MLDDRTTTFSWEDAAEDKTEKALARAQQMIAWFLEHYEDPVERTPYCSAEGGYQCELYDARGEIEGHFLQADGFSEAEWAEIIAAAVDEVEADGVTDWTEVIVDKQEPEPASDEVWLLRAADHQWGKGHVHRYVFEDAEGKTLCGRTRAACPGEMDFGDPADITCKACLSALKRRGEAAP